MARLSQRCLTVAVVFLAACWGAFADGGGGMQFGYQTSRYPFLDNYPVAENSLGLVYFGGFGYGVARNRGIVGGFGYAVIDGEGTTGVGGGFGGFITGYRLLSKPLNISVVSHTGFGGISTGAYETEAGSGFFGLFQEVALELGLPLVRWFMPTVYAGYQVIGNLLPGRLFQSFFSYTPVVGLKIQWGRFY